MNLKGSDEKIKLAHWLEDGARSGAMGTMIDSPHAFSKRESYERTGHIHKQEVTDYGSKTLATVALVAACIIPSLALGAVLIYIALAPQLIDAKIAAGAAKAEATAQTAKEHARVALDKVEQTQVQLGAKGFVQPSTH